MSATKERLTKLIPQIQSQSRHWTARYPQAGVDPADYAQGAFLAFLERAEADPDFLGLPDGEIVRRCVLDGWNACRSQRRQEYRQLPLLEGYNGEELLASDGPGPEEQLIRADLAERVRRTVAGLKPKYRAVCRGLMAGLPKGEIMAGLGIKPQNFAWYRRKLAVALGEVAA